uniref:Tyrosinase n=1 Tax=Schmidtea mediterranea TaxID=79327 RepID=H9B8J5_SCHMD|nr:tyrosinase [Schmidtea mediterranea]
MRSYDVFIFLSVLNISKYQLADFLITNSSSNLHCDPVNEDNIQLVNASIYDTMVYLHFYASRSTMSKELMESCTDKDNKLDFAHKGPAFFTWHRHYLLMFEDLLRSIAVEQFGYFNFTLPYWDWTNQTTCNICTNDLLGDIPTEDQESNSTFFKWKPICPQKPNDFDCHICDPSQEEPFLWRKYSSTVDRLPNQNEIDELFSINQYDSEPFNSSTFSRKSFRNFAEGYYRVDQNSDDMKMKDIGKGLPHQNIMMHNMVHSFINGTWMDFTTSPNDPLFLLHHTFMDKIFEIWLLRNRRSTYPGKSSTPIGQHADDFIVPFLPLIRNRNLFTSANEFGYAYDNNIVGNKLFKNHQLDFEKSSSEIYYILTAVAFVVLVATIVGLYCFRPSQISHTAYEFIEDQEQEEKTNYFNNNEKMPLLK